MRAVVGEEVEKRSYGGGVAWRGVAWRCVVRLCVIGFRCL